MLSKIPLSKLETGLSDVEVEAPVEEVAVLVETDVASVEEVVAQVGEAVVEGISLDSNPETGTSRQEFYEWMVRAQRNLANDQDAPLPSPAPPHPSAMRLAPRIDNIILDLYSKRSTRVDARFRRWLWRGEVEEGILCSSGVGVMLTSLELLFTRSFGLFFSAVLFWG